MKEKFGSILKAALFTFALIYILYNPFQITYHCQKAVELCFRTVIPSLFIFTVFSNLLSFACINTKTVPRFFCSFSEHIFGLDAKLLILCIFGFFAGAVPAMSGIMTLFKSGGISKQSCENAVILLPGCSVPFILTVAASSIGSTPLAYLLIFSNFLAVLTSFFILCKREKNFNDCKAHFNRSIQNKNGVFAKSVSISMESMINMCAFIIFFKVLSGVICDLLSKFLYSNSFLTSAINGFLEITGGVVSAGAISGNEKIPVICAVCGFSGISIVFQIIGICSKYDIRNKNFIYSRILCAVLCPIYMLIFLMLFPRNITCFSPLDVNIKQLLSDNYKLFYRSFIIGISVLTALLMLIIDKKHKNND